MSQTVDPAVTRAKFDRELARFTALQFSYAKRGILLLSAEFPRIEVAFVAVKVHPAVVILTARFDFTDFDVRPLSVQFIDFRTREPLAYEQLLTKLNRLDPSITPETAATLTQTGQPIPIVPAIQPGERPFLCLPGVREYHDHAAHSGNHWELHRASGQGAMIQLIEKIWQYGADPIDSISVNVMQSYQQSQVPA